ncbi:MAG TPA: papain-like cysteine protease family protein [Pyrinomonadaceae bacterium]|nr:papain-like cysteine protease family protein [Pyrinomonadaceae bacterium]
MGWEHFKGEPVKQDKEKMGCWAACMSWWLASVRKINWSMQDIASLYKIYTAAPGPDCTIGGLTDAGVKAMFADNRWSIFQNWLSRAAGQIDLKTLDSHLSCSPTFISYYDPALKGAHMNVIIARSEGEDPFLYVMDPDCSTYVRRKLNYYTEKSQTIVLASAQQWNY